MKAKNGLKNATMSMVSNIVVILVGLISQGIFIKILGTEYLGLNGLFTNIITMLGIVELGMGSAIIYNLYKPLKEKNIETIKSLMKFYKKSYNVIAIIVLLIGLSIIPFLPFIIKKITIDININLVYILFIIDIVFSYFLSYKRSILYADQKNYIINIFHIICYILMNIFQLLILYITKNYYLYLIIKIIFRILENIFITLYVNKTYLYLSDKKTKKLDSKIEKDIFKKVKALFYHKIGTFIVFGTDNIVISKFLGLKTVGLYSNYYLIINAVDMLFSQAITSLTPSVGHMLVEKNTSKNYDVFMKIRFITFYISTFSAVSLLIIMDPFITIWLGNKYLLSNVVLCILVFNYFQLIMRSCYQVFKEAAGIYYEDRYIPLIESFTNIIFSIILVKLIGLPGVFIGTFISGLVLWCYSYPKYVYKNIFKRSYINYIKETIGYILLFIIISSFSYFISYLLKTNDMWLNFIINILLAIIIPNIIILIVFNKSDNFIYFKKTIKKIIKKK